MENSPLEFRITDLHARVADGVVLQWQGQELSSGPLNIELDKNATGSQGVLDYKKHRANAMFQVLLTFPELAGTLETLGVDSALTEPVRAVIHSAGQILDDHSFQLSGSCKLTHHALFGSERVDAFVLPGT